MNFVSEIYLQYYPETARNILISPPSSHIQNHARQHKLKELIISRIPYCELHYFQFLQSCFIIRFPSLFGYISLIGVVQRPADLLVYTLMAMYFANTFLHSQTPVSPCHIQAPRDVVFSTLLKYLDKCSAI